MTTPFRVLVTAAGGDLGQALLKALRLSPIVGECHGCDADSTGIGPAFVDGFHEIPLARESGYVARLEAICRKTGIDVVVPASEPEIRLLSRLGRPPRLPAGVPVICLDADWIETYGDKLTCMRSLAGQVELAPFADSSDDVEVERLLAHCGLPLVVKPRRLSGSRSLHVARTPDELRATLRSVTDAVVQGFIDDSDGEFSVGVFATDDWCDLIAFKRQLGAVGCSWSAETSTDLDVLGYARTIAEVTGLRGAANIQVRKGTRGVRLLEINPRFSSLVAARALCGFADVEWSLAARLGLDLPRPSQPYRYIRFRRFFHELVDLGDGFGAPPSWQPRQVAGSRQRSGSGRP